MIRHQTEGQRTSALSVFPIGSAVSASFRAGARTSACLAVLLALSGCGLFKKDPAPDDPVPLKEFNHTVSVRKAWSYDIGKAGPYTFVPVVYGNSVYAAGGGGKIVRLNAESGAVQWSVNADSKLTAGVGTDGKVVVVAAAKGLVMAFDADTGKKLWASQASTEILSPPGVGQGMVVVRSVDDLVSAFDLGTGQRKWTMQRTLPQLTLLSAPGISIVPQAAFVGFPGGRIAAINLATGSPWWEMAVGIPHGITELERVSDAAGTPVINGRNVCAVAFQGNIACYDAGTGAARWAKKFSSSVGLGLDRDAGTLYASAADGTVQAYVAEDGRSVWQNDQLGYRGLSAPVSDGKVVAVGDFAGYVHFLSKEDGHLVGRIETDKSQILAAPALAGDAVIVQTQKGLLAALIPKS